jgi:hypothetical protein
MINLIKEQNEVRKMNATNYSEVSTTETSSNGVDEVIESCVKAEANEYATNERNTSSNSGKEASLKKSYLMQPPDSESIAAATEKHKLNRSTRRTRTKYDDKQVTINV